MKDADWPGAPGARRIEFAGATSPDGSRTGSQIRLGLCAGGAAIFTNLTVMENLEVGAKPARDARPPWTEDAVRVVSQPRPACGNRTAGRMSGGNSNADDRPQR